MYTKTDQANPKRLQKNGHERNLDLSMTGRVKVLSCSSQRTVPHHPCFPPGLEMKIWALVWDLGWEFGMVLRAARHFHGPPYIAYIYMYIRIINRHSESTLPEGALGTVLWSFLMGTSARYYSADGCGPTLNPQPCPRQSRTPQPNPRMPMTPSLSHNFPEPTSPTLNPKYPKQLVQSPE